jgi:glycosyltransferase involved in cell wall biosynthesis
VRIPTYVRDNCIIVDDGSIDETEHIARRFNIAFGLRMVLDRGADYAIEIHGDGQYDPQVLPRAMKHIQVHKADLLLGSRFMDRGQARRDGMPVLFYVANKMLSAVNRAMFRLPLSEFHTGFHIYSKRLMQRIPLSSMSKDHLFSFEIIAVAKFYRFIFAEVPVRCDYRRPHSSMRVGEGIVFVFHMCMVFVSYLFARWGIRYTKLFSRQ